MADRLSSATIAELKRELAARERKVGALLARRESLAAKLAEIDSEIARLGGDVSPAPPAGAGRSKAARGPKGRRKLPKNDKPLMDYARAVLADAPAGLRVREVVEAVRQAGYRTFSKDFYGVVANALRTGPFEKVGRGVYRLAKAGQEAPQAAVPAAEGKAPGRKAAARRSAGAKKAAKAAKARKAAKKA